MQRETVWPPWRRRICIACAKRSETRRTRHIGDKLPVSRLSMNVNKAVSKQEMRKREKEDRGGDSGGGGGHNYKSLISSENHKVSSQKGS